MIVISEINNTLSYANDIYLELTKQYINYARLGNNIIEIFTKLNIIKVCRHALKTYSFIIPQITESEFEHIKDLICGVGNWLFSLGYTTTLSTAVLYGVVTGNGAYNGEMNWLYYSFQAGTDNQTEFMGLPFTSDNIDPEAIRFVINGELMIYGVSSDYHVLGNTLYWHNSLLNIDIQDKLTIAYYII